MSKSSPAEAERIAALNREDEAVDGDYVLYWMQASQRAAHNPALELAISLADERGLPVLVGFGLMDDYPQANQRHYAFMLEGLADTARALETRGIGFVIRRGAPQDVALDLGGKARLIVCDRGYLRHQRAWREEVAKKAKRRVVQVEGDVVVPVETASSKAEIGARTLRPRIGRHLDRFLSPLAAARPKRAFDGRLRSDIDLADIDRALALLRIDRSICRVARFKGGHRRARRRLTAFIENGLSDYAGGRSDPARGLGSHLSPYLHFGQISPVEMALAVRGADGPREGREAFVEELVVRRELAMNYVFYTENYDRFDAMPDWARKSLQAHEADPREHVYSRARLERAETHDPYWNAAMREMTRTGYMHNHMRMYWGKRVLAWSKSAEEAHATLLALNNAYFLDGRDPNSYANVGWIFGLHDRGWPERGVFGKVRSMTAGGLERKFDIKAYCRFVDGLKD